MTMYLVCMIAESTVKPITVASDICNDCNLIFVLFFEWESIGFVYCQKYIFFSLPGKDLVG